MFRNYAVIGITGFVLVALLAEHAHRINSASMEGTVFSPPQSSHSLPMSVARSSMSPLSISISSAHTLKQTKKVAIVASDQKSSVAFSLIPHSSTSSTRSAASSTTIFVQAWTLLRYRMHRGGGGGGDPTALRANAESSSEQSSSVAALSTPTITLTAITKNYGDANFSLSPTSNSTGAFTYASSNVLVATITGNTVTITGAGSTTITITQAANGIYAAGSTTTTLTVQTIAPTLGTFANVSKNVGDIPFTLTAPTSNSAGAFTYTSSNPSVATVSGNTVTIVSNGTTTITATQATNGNYTSGTKTMTLTVGFGGCISAPCENGGVCTNEPGGSYSCSCAEGFSGTNCEMDGSNCADDGPGACLNGGTCVPNAAHGECSCAPCYFGLQCELNECL